MSARFDPQWAEAMDVEYAHRIVATARTSGLRPHAALLDVAGGCAVFTGPDSHLSRAVGVGRNRPVTAADLDALEHFYRSRGARCAIEVSPYAHPALIEQLPLRGFRPVAWTDVLARPLADVDDPGTGIEPVAPEGLDDWAREVESAFAEGATAGEGFVRDTRIMARLPGVTVFLARLDGAAAGGGLLAVDGTLAWLGSGAVLPVARRRGLHGRLIRARLAAARARGATWAWVGARPGSPSHRNLLGHGFTSAAMRMRFADD